MPVFARYRATSLAGDNTLLGYQHLTMKTLYRTLDPKSCRFCMDAINCEEPLQPNHLHKLVQKRNRPRVPTCLKCGQLQIFPFGQDKKPAYPHRYGDFDYIPSGESIPHTKRCTKHNEQFQKRIKQLAELQDFLSQSRDKSIT
jgi:hypothetical protein